jgi:DNA-binding transcriptional ArsR family regulator
MSRASEQAFAEVFFALGDTTRLALITKLQSEGAMSATALSDRATVSRQQIVKHLQVLESAGLVKHERHGREVLYALEIRRLHEARAFLDAMSAGWDRAIENLRAMVESPEPPSQKRRGR